MTQQEPPAQHIPVLAQLINRVDIQGHFSIPKYVIRRHIALLVGLRPLQTSYVTTLDRIHFGHRNRRAPPLYNATFSLLTGIHLRCTIQSHSLHCIDLMLTEFLQTGQSFCKDFAISIFQRYCHRLLEIWWNEYQHFIFYTNYYGRGSQLTVR